MSEQRRPDCEACKTGIEESWEKWALGLADTPWKLLKKALQTETKRAISAYFAGCEKHLEDARDRQDFITVMMQGLISDIRPAEVAELETKQKMTSSYWIEGRRKLREERAAGWGPPRRLMISLSRSLSVILCSSGSWDKERERIDYEILHGMAPAISEKLGQGQSRKRHPFGGSMEALPPLERGA